MTAGPISISQTTTACSTDFITTTWDGTFTNTIDQALPHTSFYSMGADLGDVNNDGLIDFLVADMAAATHEKDQRGVADARGRTEDLHIPTLAPAQGPPQRAAAEYWHRAACWRQAAYLRRHRRHQLDLVGALGGLRQPMAASIFFVTNGYNRDPESRRRQSHEEGREPGRADPHHVFESPVLNENSTWRSGTWGTWSSRM